MISRFDGESGFVPTEYWVANVSVAVVESPELFVSAVHVAVIIVFTRDPDFRNAGHWQVGKFVSRIPADHRYRRDFHRCQQADDNNGIRTP